MPPPQKSVANERYHIRAVERALTLLRIFLSHDTDLSATEIGQHINLGPSTTFRLLVTLESQGFVEQDPTTGKYHLGVACLELGSQYLKTNNLRERVLGVLNALRNEFGETTHLAVLDGSEVVYLEKLPGLYPIGLMSSRVGGRTPAYCTGVGKVLLAYLPDEALQELYPTSTLARYTDTTITDLEKLRVELAEIREQGYGLDQEEHEPGVMCVAIPIFKHNGIAAAMSISGPAERIKQHIKNEELIKKAQQAGAQISRQMGGGWAINQIP